MSALSKIKYFLKKYSTAVTALLFLAAIFLLLELFFYADARCRAHLPSEVSCMTECGAPPERTSLVSAAAGDGIVYRSGSAGSSMLAITCNVDWGEDVIPDILETLDTYNVKITFFVTGKWAEKNPSLLREMYLRGHEIQNHGYSHKLCSQVSEDEITSEIDKTSKIISRIIGIKTTAFAPPSGDFDERTVQVCREKGYLLSLWSADTIDWREGSTADVIYNRIMVKELHGAIILMHPKEETAKALPLLLESFGEQQLQPVTLSELLGNDSE